MNKLVSALLYIIIVFVWGTTWIAITYQTGDVAVENSIFYRFFAAAVLLFAFLALTKKRYPLTRNDHFHCLLQGACLFCFNFYCFYKASFYIESGLLSVIFSMATLFNVVNNRLWHKVIPSKNTVIGSVIGIMGITLLFLPDLLTASDAKNRLLGIALATLATFFFSCGNMLSVRHNKRQLPLATTNAWGLLYGSLIMLCISWVSVGSFNIDTRPLYLFSLLYLIVPGTIIAFAVYLGLIARIGANKTAYATILFPIVALSISTVLEGYTFSPIAIIGLVLAILGNVIVFYKPRLRPNAISEKTINKSGEPHVSLKT